MSKVQLALLSVSDKRGIVELARALHARGVALLSTGGTALALSDSGLPVTDVGRHTAFPEMLDGRVKTLHPRIHGGILARRDVASHREALAAHDIPTIDLVVVNLYPFRETVAKLGTTLEDAIENIDIGGPAMVRSAAKNWKHVGVVVDPDDYPRLLEALDAGDGALPDATRFAFARKAFAHTSAYDGAIANWLTSRGADGAERGFPSSFRYAGELVQPLRYGENPHQQGAFYRDESPAPGSIATYLQRHGKELSYNNIADTDAAWECVSQFRVANVRDRQACQPLRRRNSRNPARGVPEGFPDRSDVGVRGDHRFQSACRRTCCRSNGHAVRRSPRRARVHAGGAGPHRAEEERARSRDPGGDGASRAHVARFQARRRRTARADRRRRDDVA